MTQRVDVGRIREAFAARRSRERRRSATAALVLVPYLVLSAWLVGWVIAVVVALCALGGLILFFATWNARATKRRRVERAVTDDAELIALHRESLDRETAALRQWRPGSGGLPWICGLAVVLLGGGLALKFWRRAELWDDGEIKQTAQLALTLVVISVSFARDWRRARVELPELEREREALPDGPPTPPVP